MTDSTTRPNDPVAQVRNRFTKSTPTNQKLLAAIEAALDGNGVPWGARYLIGLVETGALTAGTLRSARQQLRQPYVPVEPEPVPVEPEPVPVEPEPDPVEPEPDPVEPEPTSASARNPLDDVVKVVNGNGAWTGEKITVRQARAKRLIPCMSETPDGPVVVWVTTLDNAAALAKFPGIAPRYSRQGDEIVALAALSDEGYGVAPSAPSRPAGYVVPPEPPLGLGRYYARERRWTFARIAITLATTAIGVIIGLVIAVLSNPFHGGLSTVWYITWMVVPGSLMSGLGYWIGGKFGNHNPRRPRRRLRLMIEDPSRGNH